MKKYTLSTFLLFLVLFLFSCTFEGKKGKVFHPTAEFISKLNSLNHTISLDSLEVEEVTSILQKPPQVLAQIGNSPDINSPNFLIDIKGIEADEYGNIFISIPELNEIRVFNKEGVFKQKIGRAGRGPGEFIRLSNIDYNKDQQFLMVADSREVELFKVSADTIFHLTTIYTEISNITDTCVLGSSFFVNGFLIKPITDSTNVTYESIQSTKPIHKFDLETGEYQFSFGYKYTSESNYGVFDGLLSQTLIECSKETNTVVGILGKFPMISAYNPVDGSPKWKAGIKDFTYRKLVEKIRSGDPTLGGTVPDFFYDKYGDLVNLHNGHLLLQIGKGVPKGFSMQQTFNFLSSEFTIRPLLINLRTGDLTSLPKKQRLVYFKNSKFTISSPPPKSPEESQQVIIAIN